MRLYTILVSERFIHRFHIMAESVCSAEEQFEEDPDTAELYESDSEGYQIIDVHEAEEEVRASDV